MTDCPHLEGDVCRVASDLVHLTVKTTPPACEQCCQQLEPRAANFVTACIAVAEVRQSQGLDEWRRHRARLRSYLVMNKEMTEAAKEQKRIESLVECEQNIGGICVVASHLAEQPVAIDARCHECRGQADWRTPNRVTAQMAMDRRPELKQAFECYTLQSGHGPGAHLKRLLYEHSARGLRRCEMDTVERMNSLGVDGCRRSMDRVAYMLKMEAEAGNFAWVFESTSPREMVEQAVEGAEQDGTTW